ncbi:hypothetical protein PR048_021207 [Dryococelus australis]|uniref:Secreted protein n=1 Tax=Dryococelus australis TaxID=614101 RepID=A0ABQ9GXL8_9NEOP|nr:hypothetical protein PR048_021207 [Dryococelus australis]
MTVGKTWIIALTYTMAVDVRCEVVVAVEAVDELAESAAHRGAVQGSVVAQILEVGVGAHQLAPGSRVAHDALWNTPAPVHFAVFRVAQLHAEKTARVLASHRCEAGSIPGGVTPEFRTWESHRTLPLFGGFPRGSFASPALLVHHCTDDFTENVPVHNPLRGSPLKVPQVHALRRELSTSVRSLAFSGDDLLDERRSFALVAPRHRTRKPTLDRREPFRPCARVRA